ncbi:MAG: transketolase family protein [Candidatus Latescibacteria bacterium]|nr:transketolase family protein [Candidatus Latescibacterota bacterium]
MAKYSLRHAFAEALVDLGKKYPNLVALEADLQDSTQSIQFMKAFPERYIQVGIAEQNMMGIAAGLALSGKIPVTHTFACFASMRACEQVRTSIAYPKLNVKIFVSHCGVSAGTAGTSHHAIEDIAIMRAIPNMTVIAPGDAREMRQAAEAAIRYDGPAYVRVGAGEAEDVYTETHHFEIGKATVLRDGNDATIISTGQLMYEAVCASDELRKQGKKIRVLQMGTVKPIDREVILEAAEETGFIVTIEEHNVVGGLGGAVAEVAAEIGKAKVRRLGIQDRFSPVGTAAYILGEEMLTINDIIVSLLEFVKE